jgi:hypothetical protein
VRRCVQVYNRKIVCGKLGVVRFLKLAYVNREAREVPTYLDGVIEVRTLARICCMQ